VPWQAVYNAACLYAMTAPSVDEPSNEAAEDAVRMLKLAVTDPACELDRPSEWIGVDPSLASLQKKEAFTAFVREQAYLDFDAAKEDPPADDAPWFQKQLPYSPRAE
jgi:hypothetical protein